MSNLHEEEALGKAYDSRLDAAASAKHKPSNGACARARHGGHRHAARAGPAADLSKAIDGYFVPALNHAIPEASAWSGIGWLSLLFLAVLTFDFLAQYIQIRIMQRVGQQTMYDMRGEIFSHMQRLPMSTSTGNPWAGWSRALLRTVDALNDLFRGRLVT